MTWYERKLWIILGQGALVIFSLICLTILGVTDSVSQDFAESAFLFIVGSIFGGVTVSVGVYLSDENRQRALGMRDMERRIRDAIAEDELTRPSDTPRSPTGDETPPGGT